RTIASVELPQAISGSIWFFLFAQSLLAAAVPGHVSSWGGTVLPYAPGSVFTAIGAGWNHGMGARDDGKVFVWGSSWDGEGHVPLNASNVVAVAGGQFHSLALSRDGRVHAWGDNYYDQSSVPIGLTNVIAIAAGSSDSLALKSDGTVVKWGYHDTNVPGGLSNVIA